VIDLRLLYAVVKKEFLDSLRSKWILGASVIFLLLALVVSYFGAASSGGGVGLQGFRETALGMGAIAAILVPIIALMLGYAAIAGEREQGSLGLLLSTPLTRAELLLGKFLGLSAVLATSILVGWGIAGGVVAAVAGTAYWDAYLAVLGAAILLGTSFLSVSILLSSLLQKRSSALGVAVFLWFFFFLIWNFILFGLYVGTGGELPRPGPGGMSLTLPDWYYGANLGNPGEAFQYFASVAFGIRSAGFGDAFPSFVTAGTTAVSLLAWTTVPLGLAYLRFRSRDV